MILCHGQTGIQIDGAFQPLYGLGVTLKDGQKEADFILNASGFWIECRRFLPFGEGTGGVTVRFQFGCAVFNLPEILGMNSNDHQEQN
ncbi:MAG TPA: hypothetical protein VKB88_22125 [Bryobacteraceae bacterium]|nr:hypothetical protein [Bryobacteraceae bacterium]